MATKTALRSMNDIIAPTNTLMDASAFSSSDQAKRLCSEPCERTLCLCGDASSMTVAKLVSTALFSGMNQRTAARISYARRMQSLIASGLIAGITPTSIRKGSPQKTLDIAFSELAGNDAAEPKAD